LKYTLKKRGQEPHKFDIPLLVDTTEGFSGAEIEQVIVSALYTAFSYKTELSNQALLDEASHTRPLSTTMAEKIEWLREWARERTVRAE
jgi:hypothetical protein